jgi:hypothetical protein
MALHDYIAPMMAVFEDFYGDVLDEETALVIGAELIEVLGLEPEALTEMVDALLVREGMVLDDMVARERVNNIVMAFSWALDDDWAFAKPNPQIKLSIRLPEPDEDGNESGYEAVEGFHPRGVPKWLAVTPPPLVGRTAEGRVPPGEWSVTHVPTGLAIVKGLSKARARRVAKAIAVNAPELAELRAQVTDEQLAHEPFLSIKATIASLKDAVHYRDSYLRRRDVAGIVDLVRFGLIDPPELFKLPPRVQVAVDAALEELDVRPV